jgi:APA family basic amino acid/polyamine antiporter
MSAPDGTGATEAAVPTLRRDLGLFEVAVYGIGLILGAGIYAVLGEAAGVAGEALPISFVAAAVVASFTGLSYAELASRFPKGEGDYVYVREAFGNKHLAEVAAFLRVFVGAVSAAAVALAFAGYLGTFVQGPTVPVAVGLVVLASVVNFWGIDVSAKLTLLFTVAEVAGLAIVIWLGRTAWGTVAVFEAPFGVPGVVEGAFLAFFAYLGFGSIVNVAEETENPTRTVPRAILLAILAHTGFNTANSTLVPLPLEAISAGDSTMVLVVTTVVLWVVVAVLFVATRGQFGYETEPTAATTQTHSRSEVQ